MISQVYEYLILIVAVPGSLLVLGVGVYLIVEELRRKRKHLHIRAIDKVIDTAGVPLVDWAELRKFHPDK